ncbi:hypothetical protein GGI43DRAFT_225569 [Trichoderma evansii]
MGLCQSCLGRRQRDVYDESEENRLLYDDGNGVQYGSFGDAALNGEGDTAEVQRENEALQRVVAKTSNNMVDIFEIAPDSGRVSSSTFVYTGQGARVARYHHLVSKLSTHEDSPPPGIKVDWLADEDANELHGDRPASLKTLDEDDAALVGTFADAAEAMKE